MKNIVKENGAEFIRQKKFWDSVGLRPLGWNQRELSTSYGWDMEKDEKSNTIWLCLGAGRGDHVFSFTDRGLQPFCDREEEASRYAGQFEEMERNIKTLANSPELLKMWDKCEDHWKYYSFDTVLSTSGDFDALEWVYSDVQEVRLHKASGKVTSVKREDSSNPYVRHNMD